MHSVFLSPLDAHHDLNSFPTRRSSDLLVPALAERVRLHEDRQPVFEAFGIEKDIEDRKSTRLNSSHLGISYAVFCLKKKKTSNTSDYLCIRHDSRSAALRVAELASAGD